MRRYKNDALLLREYVRSILVEEDGGGVSVGGDYGGGFSGGGMGGGLASSGELYAAFVKPFTRVLKTTLGQAKIVARKAGTLLWVGLQVVLTTIIPFYGYDYADVFKKEKEDIDKIKKEYKSVHDETAAILGGGDAPFICLMTSPALFLGAAAMQTAPKFVKKVSSALTGGLSEKGASLFHGDARADETIQNSGKILLHQTIEMMLNEKKRHKGGHKGHEARRGKHKGLHKKGERGSNEDIKNNPNVLAASSKVKKIYTKRLRAIVEIYKKQSGVESIEDIEKIINESNGEKKDDALAKIRTAKNLQGEEKKAAVKQIISTLKTASKGIALKQLNDILKAIRTNSKIKKLGVDIEELDYVIAINAAIKEIT